MLRYLVVVANGATARIFALEPAEFPAYESSPHLVECGTLHDPTLAMHEQDLWANVKTGRNRGAGGQAHSYDDGREQHALEFERRFAREVGATVMQIVQQQAPHRFVLVAAPQVMATIREAIALPAGTEMRELTKDLCSLSPQALYSYLAAKNLLPPQQRARV